MAVGYSYGPSPYGTYTTTTTATGYLELMELEQRKLRQSHDRFRKMVWQTATAKSFDPIMLAPGTALFPTPLGKAKQMHACVDSKGEDRDYVAGLVDFHRQLVPELVKREEEVCTNVHCLLSRIEK